MSVTKSRIKHLLVPLVLFMFVLAIGISLNLEYERSAITWDLILSMALIMLVTIWVASEKSHEVSEDNNTGSNR